MKKITERITLKFLIISKYLVIFIITEIKNFIFFESKCFDMKNEQVFFIMESVFKKRINNFIAILYSLFSLAHSFEISHCAYKILNYVFVVAVSEI